MRSFLYSLLTSIKKIFQGRNLFWQIIMIVLTAFFVLSGFDWWYFVATRNPIIQTIGFSAGLFGFIVPVFLIIVLLGIGSIKKDLRLTAAGYAALEAGFLGLVLSSFYKVFTGRIGLPHGTLLADVSRVFQFGIYRGGAFQGWPSSHTTVAFAMSIALVTLFPEKKPLRYILLGYALFIAIGASVAFHWWSDSIAGIIFGSVIGVVVGKKYFEKLPHD